MSNSTKKHPSARKPPPALSVAFWRWLVLGVILSVAALLTDVFGLSAFLPTSIRGHFQIAVLVFACIVYPVWAIGLVWRAGRESRILARWSSRLGAIFIWFVSILLGLGYVTSSHRHDYGTRARVFNGVTLLHPHRTAVENACREKALRSGMSAADMGLEGSPNVESPIIRSVTIEVANEANAKVVIVFKAIGDVVSEGDTVIYSGTCGSDGMTWENGGTVPAPYRPKW